MTSPAQIGSYRIQRLLGTGSFATVWLGHDPSLDAHVAIKVLAENWNHDLRVRERFLDEGRLLWRLDHERIVRIHSLGELPDGRPYLVMAWADGGSLRDRLAAGPIAPGPALHLLREIAAGVAVLHDRGIVHRDLTPGNILFRSRASAGPGRPTEQVVVADLGLAKALAAASGLTARAGTPGYMAPEQDDPMAVVDPRTDVYGLGRLGARLLGISADRPVDAAILLRTGVPPAVAAVLTLATAHRPGDRHPDAAAFAAALDRATAPPRRPAAGRPAEQPRRPAAARPADEPHRPTAVPAAPGPPAPDTTTSRPSRRRPVLAGAVALAIAAAASALAADSVAGSGRLVPGLAADPTGRITVAVPGGWRASPGIWKDRRGPDGRPDPALVLSPMPERWAAPRRWSTEEMPGAFIGLARGAAARTTPTRFVAARPHAVCAAAPVRTSRQAGIDWVVARYTGCPWANEVLVETAGIGPGGSDLVYAQIAPPRGSGTAFVDTLLAGIRIR